MSLRTSATRYARALLDVAVKESDPGRIERELGEVLAAITEHDDLARALTSPRVPVAVKVGIVRALAERAALAPPLAKLLVMLAEGGRLELVPALVDVYRERLLAHGNIIRAAVTSATPLAGDRLQALEERLHALTGKQVQLTAHVDPALIGGLVARIGSTVYDGSIRTQLAKMKERLVENA